MTWHQSPGNVWNLGSSAYPDTAWVWSHSNVSCPNEINDWSYWDENNDVKDASADALKFVCLTPSN